MSNLTIGRMILTCVLVVGAILGFALDWRDNHLLNPLWHAHAKFHGALLLFLLGGVSAVGVWILWRRSTEPHVGVKVAALISASFWTPFFYVTFILPGSTLWAGAPGGVPHLAGIVIYPNAVTAAIFLIMTTIGYGLARRMP
jgi:hypothetical protein